MKNPNPVTTYIFTTLFLIIILITFVRTPKVVFIDIGCPGMHNLFYISLVLSIAKFSIDIINFILLKLRWYHFLRIEQNDFKELISKIRQENKYLKNELFDIKNELGSMRKRIAKIEKNK